MNFLFLKYLVVIAGMIGTTAIVSLPFTPYALGSQPEYQGEITAESMIQFGSDTFYSEIEKSGNEYLKEGVEGYSQDLLPTGEQEQRFNSAWASGTASYKNGYNGCIESFYRLLTVPDMQDTKEKTRVCEQFRLAKEDLEAAITAFTAAKSSVAPSSSQGFLIGMVLPRVNAIGNEAEDAEIACMKAVLANRDDDQTEFEENIHDAEENIREMRRLNPELTALSDDFRQ